MWPDADWNGDFSTSRSTSGFHCELEADESGNVFPLCHKAAYQSFTSSSSAESETASASVAVRHTAIPIQMLMEAFLQRTLPISVRIDNMQAISAIKKGYSKKLRHLSRTHRCSIGAMHDLEQDPDAAVNTVHAGTKTHKGDFYTKCLGATAFGEARDRVGLAKPDVCVKQSAGND